MVTVEGAYAIAAIVIVVIAAVGAITTVTAQIRCTDAAREVARLVAAGDEWARSAGQQLVGSGAQISVAQHPDRIVVEVHARAPLLPGVSLSARAVAAPEPDADDQVQFAPGIPH
ncbi:MAG: TadE family type IV pilus minor pilin [Gordonia sp. (in: high G+C Gram-positive bacteria)]